MINYGRHYIDKKDIYGVVKILSGKFLTQGSQIEKFEKSIAVKFKSKFCSVVSSGTAALHLSALALNWKRGDTILLSPITFLASANAILYCGASPEFVDIDEHSYNIDINKLEDKIKQLKKNKKKVKGIIATDYAGNPCDWHSIKYLANKYGIKTINDNCHAIGARINNDIGYASKYADIVCHSYHPVKAITTGEGGSVITENSFLDKKIKILRSHGIQRNKFDDPWFYKMNFLGYNYRITDFQCALGLTQLKKLDLFLKRRHQIANIYNEAFRDNDLCKIPKVFYINKHAYHLYPLRVNFKKIKIKKNFLFNRLKKKKIYLQVHYIPIYKQPYYKKNFQINSINFPVAEKFYSEEVSLPIYYKLKDDEVMKVISEIKKIMF